jgi:ribosomal protein S1
MAKFMGMMVVTVVLGLGAWAYAADMGTPGSASGGAAAAAAKEASSAQTVSGEVLKIEGENYVVKDAMGKEVKLHVSPETKKDGDIKVGDKIEAQADATGHAISIKAAQAAK